MDHRRLEQIENYHAGRMNPDEVAAFEYKLASDPALKAESDFQAEIIDGLKDYRKAQLKTRLEAVDLAPSWIEFAQQSTLMKSFGGIAVATFVGAGVFLVGDQIKKEDTSESITIDSPEYTDPEFIWNLGEEDLPKLAEVKENEETDPSKNEDLVEEVQVEKVDAEEASKEVVAFTPTFNAPDAESIKDEDALSTSELDVLPEDTEAVTDEQPVDVETEINKSIKVQYKYYDGKLFLSGDFDRAPYEILEINSAKGRRIYVKYLDKYYQVNTTDKLTDLPEVTNKEVIEELKLLRKNK